MKQIKSKSIQDYLQISQPANIFLNILMIIICIACVYPLLLVFSISITDEQTIALSGYHLIPEKFSLYAYQYVLSNYMTIIRAYGITIFVTIVGSLLSLSIIAMYAYPLSRKNFKYRNTFSFIAYFTMLFNAGLVPWYIVYVRVLHLKDSILALIIPALMSAMSMIIMRTFFKTGIPDSLVDAAKIDGAGEFYTFIKIVLPLSTPVIATILLFNTLHYWNDWYTSLVFINDPNKYSLQYLLYKVEKNMEILMNYENQNLGVSTELLSRMPSQTSRMAIAMIAVGPIVFAYPFFQKYFVKGLTIGAVKG